jgi:transketolase C-terminal domain/subunit
MKFEDYPVHDSIRGWFGRALYFEMQKDERIWCLTGDLGFGLLDQIRNDFPKRFVNVGASEQALVGAGVGLRSLAKFRSATASQRSWFIGRLSGFETIYPTNKFQCS